METGINDLTERRGDVHFTTAPLTNVTVCVCEDTQVDLNRFWSLLVLMFVITVWSYFLLSINSKIFMLMVLFILLFS